MVHGFRALHLSRKLNGEKLNRKKLSGKPDARFDIRQPGARLALELRRRML
jgi:hypothetical protein